MYKFLIFLQKMEPIIAEAPKETEAGNDLDIEGFIFLVILGRYVRFLMTI